MKKLLLSIIVCLLSGAAVASSDSGVKLDRASIRPHDQDSLQRGAKTYMSACSSCHSLKYMRYGQLAEGIGLTDSEGKLDHEAYVKLFPSNPKPVDPILSMMTPAQAEQTFGIVPPDLTLISRVMGNNWVYTYFHSFYKDPESSTGSNNVLFPGVAMPNIFEPMQGAQVPVYRIEMKDLDGQPTEVKVIDHLELERQGSMPPELFDQSMLDLVNFLDYVAEPAKLTRIRMGVWVLLFLVIFLIVSYLLKKEYWRNVH